MAEKIVNYTPEQTAEIVNAYKAGQTVEQISALVGKSVRSVVAKLSREGVYKPKAKAASTRVTKAQLISTLAERYGVDPKLLASLEKASLEALEILVRDRAVD